MKVVNNDFGINPKQISINDCYIIDILGVPAPIFIGGNAIKNNIADIGGALGVSDCWSIVYANEMYNNVGNDYGGGLYIETDDNIKWNKIKGNQSPYGAGIYIKGAYNPKIHDNDIYLNTADYGGAIYCTDGTSAEIYENEIFGNSSTQNGGAIFIPRDYFSHEISCDREDIYYKIVELGTPYSQLRKVFKEMCSVLPGKLKGFGDCTPSEIARLCGFSLPEAERALQREYDEPFLVEGKVPQDVLHRAPPNRGRPVHRPVFAPAAGHYPLRPPCSNPAPDHPARCGP